MSALPDKLFADTDLAALYDPWCGREGRDDFAFYRPMVMAASAVLDVGCGTGLMLHQARDGGHRGRLCGLDPAPGMLAQARKRSDIEWVQGDAVAAAFASEFDLIVMTGHAFQALLEDDQLRDTLAAVRQALKPNGRFAFETRNPLARAWERWTPEHGIEITDAAGRPVRIVTEVVETYDGRAVSFTHTFTCGDWEEVSHSTLRFLSAEAVTELFRPAGLVVEAQFGDWDRSPVSAASPEIITIARTR